MELALLFYRDPLCLVGYRGFKIVYFVLVVGVNTLALTFLGDIFGQNYYETCKFKTPIVNNMHTL